MTTRIAITSSLFLGIDMWLLPSAQAMSPPPLHRSDGIREDVGYRGVARGHRYGVARGHGRRRHGYGGYRPTARSRPPPSPQVRVVGCRARLP